MKKNIYLFIVVGILSSCANEKESNNEASSEKVTIAGIDFPTTLSQEENLLVFNGGGTRSKLFVKVYAGALYLPEKNRDGNEIIEADQPSIIRMVAISSFFTSKKMSETVREKFNESVKGNVTPFQSRIDLLCGMLDTATIHKGDYLDVWYTPNTGIRFLRNGVDLNVIITGLDFKQAFFKNWLSEETPADESLRRGMLGL